MAMRNTRTGGTRKRVAGETKKGATPKEKGSKPKVSAMDRARMIAEHARIKQSVSKTSTTNRPKTSPEDDSTPPRTKKVNPNEESTTTYKRPVSRPTAKPAPGQNVVKTPVTKAQRPNSGAISKPAVKAPANRARPTK